MLNGLIKVKRIKKTLFDILSFSYAKYRFCSVLLILIILLIAPLNYLTNLPNLSICNHLFGKYCYSVGITRGVSSLLKGDFQSAWDYNPLSIGVLLGLLMLLVYDALRIRNRK